LELMMPNTGMLMLGGLALLWLARGQNGAKGSNPLASLLNADIASSGSSSFGGNVDNLEPPGIVQLIGGDTQYRTTGVAKMSRRAEVQGLTSLAVDPLTGIPIDAQELQPPAPEIAGTLSALFEAIGPTISEVSGNAVRQVGLLGRYDSPLLATSNSPSVAFIDITTAGGGPPVLLEEDTPIQVLAPVGGGRVISIEGNDETTVVTSGVNLGLPYFTTPGTVFKAIDKGYFDPPAAYVPRTWQQIEADWAAAQSETAVAPVATVATYDISISALDWTTGFELEG
jgi:hypothetical protein